MSSTPFDESLLRCPDTYQPRQHTELTPDQITKLKTIDDHFNAPNYQLLTLEGGTEKERLNEREMMFLVSS
jgi:hypothetical protein